MFHHVTLVVAGFSKLCSSHGLGDRWHIVYGFVFYWSFMLRENVCIFCSYAATYRYKLQSKDLQYLWNAVL